MQGAVERVHNKQGGVQWTNPFQEYSLKGALEGNVQGVQLGDAREPKMDTHLDHGVYERLPDIVQHLPHILHVRAVGFAFRHCHVHALQQLWHCLHCCLPYLFVEVELQQWNHDLRDLCAQMGSVSRFLGLQVLDLANRCTQATVGLKSG